MFDYKSFKRDRKICLDRFVNPKIEMKGYKNGGHYDKLKSKNWMSFSAYLQTETKTREPSWTTDLLWLTSNTGKRGRVSLEQDSPSRKRLLSSSLEGISTESPPYRQNKPTEENPLSNVLPAHVVQEERYNWYLVEDNNFSHRTRNSDFFPAVHHRDCGVKVLSHSANSPDLDLTKGI